jgi:hypothetical protein
MVLAQKISLTLLEKATVKLITDSLTVAGRNHLVFPTVFTERGW